MKSSKTFWMNFLPAAKIVSAAFLFMVFLLLTSKPSYAQIVASGANSYSSYAILTNGTLYTWGKNQYGQLGNGTTTNDSTPVIITFPSGVTQWMNIVGGDSHTLALGNDGNVYAWGRNNYGQLGNGTTTDSPTPVIVTKPAGVTSWTAITAGSSVSYAIGNDGNAYAWGYNNFGQLGDSTISNSSSPVKVKLPAGITAGAISSASNSAVAIGSDGNVYAWGRNGNGQLGIGTTTDSHFPVKVNLPVGVTAKALSSGGFFNSALCSDGNIYGFGQGNNGQIGNGTASGSAYSTPVAANLPAGVTSWKTYATGASFVLAIGNNDSLYAWGFNGTGELGVVTGVSNNPNPINVVLPAGVMPRAVATGHNHSLIVGDSNYVYAWGRNAEGQLGINSTVNSPLPVRVNGVGGNGNLILPVELTSFTAAATTNGVLLNWKTATEMNNSGFAVERSSDNKAFAKIAFIKGNGTTTNVNDYTYLDKNASGALYYRLNQIDFDGTAKYSQVVEVNVARPLSYSLKQNYPNPFNPTTIISYSIPTKSFVSIKVYNILGNVVASLVNNQVDAGVHNVEFNASSLSSGVYFYTINAGNFAATKKLMLLK